MAEIFWHNLEIEEVAKLLKIDIKNGLSEKEVELLQRKLGKNKLPEEKPLSRLRIFLEQFQSPLIYILVIAGIITLILRDFTDAIVIFGAVFLNTIVGFIQENKANQTLRALKKVVKHEAQVLRGGNLKIVDSIELVIGDIIILNSGDKVPADGRIIESYDLKINEMVLTGEWLSVKKKPEVLPKETPLADRDNMVYMGTIVEGGKGKAIVIEIGPNTELGKVATMVRETKEEKTPYQKKLAHFSKIVGIVIGLICFGIFIIGLVTGKEFIEMFTTALAVAVAAIPEGLPVAMTVILALGMQRILKRRGLVRRLAITETLGSTSIICSDKTATLTEGRMKVDEIIGDKFLTLKAAIFSSEAFIENPEEPKEKWVIRGRPTDRALLEAGIELGIDKKREFEKKKIVELPFDPINKFAAALYWENKEQILYICGAPEKILELSKSEKIEKENWEKKLEELAEKGLRVVACAYKKIKNQNSKIKNLAKEIKDLFFLGFITLKDPIRPEAIEAMKISHQAGIRPIIVTGDHKLTAKAVAEELGFKIKEENILEGENLDKLSDEDFEKILDKIQIYTRVEPKHKMRIINAWQMRGEVVAMTGDGINDAPALKKADIGVALGSGTEVAKETSDLILLNDSFSIILAAVEEGRAILDNIRKVITYLFCSAFNEVLLVGTSIFAGWPLPILAAQILWINLIEDGPLSLALAFEPKEKDLMEQKPANQEIPLLSREMKALIFGIGIITDLLLIGLFFWLFKFSGYEISHIRSVIFAGLAIDSIFYIFSCRSLRKNIWQINLFSNRFLILAWIFAIMVLLAGLYLPILQTFLKTTPLTFFDWQLVFGLGLLNLILIEATKWYFITKSKIKNQKSLQGSQNL
jgi:Ca2+-transporting ATPase